MAQFYLVKEMINKINIFSEISYTKFFEDLLPDYILSFYCLDELFSNVPSNEGGIIFLTNNYKKKYDLKKLSKPYILLFDKKISTNHNLVALKIPIEPDRLKKEINNFLSMKIIEFCDIKIKDRKMTNTLNKLSCTITDIEKNILIYLIDKKTCEKKFLKEKVLGIKREIITNSLESHLTRIRKKFDKIQATVNVKTKNDFVQITSI